MFDVSKFLQLIRVLFPKWSFFDQSGTVYVLEAKPVLSRSWTELDSPSSKPFGSLFHNPEINLLHAHENLIREFLYELKPIFESGHTLSKAELEGQIVFQQIAAWVACQMREMDFRQGAFQFRLREKNGEAFFVSHEILMERR